MVSDLKEAFSIDNLRRAWRWLNSNPDYYYKSFFRHIYRAYAIAAEENIKDLHKRLVNSQFDPEHSIKTYFPKKSGIQRVYTFLSVEDQIVYQALVNIVADRLSPKVKARYHKENFGNLYAGSRSIFFYQDWKKNYKKFSFEINRVYNKGFIYSASFDLTACYDSIDHNVLKHFLGDIGLQKEFNNLLCTYLMKWTATRGEKRIYQGHGIPQGPLSSGLLSEVVLRHFDDNKSENQKKWRYFRYVDDMRFFAKNEHDLRSMIVEMDLLSKQIGLFPQNSKIGIHKVKNIDEEIKSISRPPEIIIIKTSVDQKKIEKRLIELSPRLKVENETRFKYVLSGASPSTGLGIRLLKILKNNPHLYVSIFNYFDQFSPIPKSITEELIKLLSENNLYPAVTAAGLRMLLNRCHELTRSKLEGYAKSIITKATANTSTELLTAATAILLKGNKLSFRDVKKAVVDNNEWWSKSVLALEIDINHFGEPSYESILNDLLKDDSVDVSVVAAELITNKSLKVNISLDQINPIAQLSLKSAGIIGARRGGTCPVSAAMQHILGSSVKNIDWKKLLSTYYNGVSKKASMLKGYSETDATAWVNLLDTIHDNLLESLLSHEPSLGIYSSLGSAINAPTGKLATKFPQIYKAFNLIHDKKYESALSHPKIRRTKRITHFIEFSFIGKSKKQLRLGYLELFRKW